MLPVNGEYFATLNNVSQIVGGDALFTCEHTFGDDVPVVISWSVIVNKKSFQIMKVRPGQTDLVYESTPASNRGIKSVNRNQLEIKRLQLTDNDIFSEIQCRVEYEKNSTPATYGSLIVMSWPEKSKGQLAQDAFSVGANVFIGKCVSGAGYPKSEISFLRNNKPAQTTVTEEEEDPGMDEFTEFTSDTADSDDLENKVSSKLFLEVTEDLDKSVIDCKVFTGNEQLNNTDIIRMGELRVIHDVSKVDIVGDKPDFIYTNGDTATFTCSHNGYPESAITGFGIEFEDEVELQSDNEISFKITPEIDGKKLICKAKTPTQETEFVAEQILKVNYVDKVKITGKSTYELGEEISLTCESTANPAVNSYTWKKDGEEMVEKSSSLKVPAEELSRAGKYSCEASNDFAKGEAEHEVVIIGITRLGEKSVKAEIKGSDKEGSELVCEVQSSSEPTFAWYKLNKDGKNEDIKAAFPKSEVSVNGDIYSQTLTAAPLDTTYSKAVFVCEATFDEYIAEKTFALPEIKGSSSVAGIVIGILVAILIIAIIIAVLYYKGIICKKEGKAGEVHADDIEVDIHNTDVEAGAPPPEEDKLLENGAGN